MGWWLPLLAGVAMYLQDILGVLMVRAEVAGRAHRAALCDTLQDACRIAGMATGLGVILLSHDVPLTVAVIAATLVADYLGTWSGVRLGQRLDRRAAA